VAFRHANAGGDTRAHVLAQLGSLDGVLRCFEMSDNVVAYYVTFTYSTAPLARADLGLAGCYPRWTADVARIVPLFHRPRKKQPA
jgi:hypothetical protein